MRLALAVLVTTATAGLLAVGLAVPGGPAALSSTTAGSRGLAFSAASAPGAPGATSYLDLGRKDCLGTARNTTSRVWYTVADGVLSDVYSPTTDNSNLPPSGTVAFSANGTTIPGCSAQPITASGSSGTATCITSFAASTSPESLTAAFTGASGSGQTASSSSPAQTLTVNQASSGTKLAASTTTPAIGANVTYTATVTPGTSGPIKPNGTVKFLDGGSPITGCTAQPLSAGGAATCTVSYAAAGSHSVTATYNGDSSFTSSTSGATTVTVSSATPPPTPHGKLVGPGGRLTVVGRTIQFTEKCSSSTLCRGSFSLTVTVRGKHHKLTTVRCASGSFKIAANKSGKIRVTLSGACMRMLRAHKAHHRLKVLYVSKSQTGQKGQRYRITLVLR